MSEITGNDVKPVRWGILGAGTIAARFAEDITRARGAVATAVAARDGARAREFAARFGIVAGYTGYASLLQDPDIDIVYIATPHSLHFEHALAAIRAGKPVLVEKPFTVDADQAQLLRREAEERGVFVMEALWTMCNPLVRKLLERIEEGALGEPVLLTANVGPMSVPVQRGAGHRLEDPDLGASFMLEALVYPLWLATTLIPALREPTTVHAAANLSAAGIDESASILLHSASGAVASLGGGLVFGSVGSPSSLLQITGTDGWAEIADDLFEPQIVRIGTPVGVEVLSAEEPTRGFAWEIEEAGRALRDGRVESLLVPIEQSVQIMRILDRARDDAHRLSAAAGSGSSPHSLAL